MMLHWVSSYGLIFPKENQQGSTDSISMNSAQDHPDIDLKKKKNHIVDSTWSCDQFSSYFKMNCSHMSDWT